MNKDRSSVTTAVSRLIEKDVTIGGVTARRQMSVQLVITVPTTGFTSSEINDAVLDIDQFVTTASLDRMLAGES